MMGLSCSCDWDVDAAWYYYLTAGDFIKMPSRKRRARCRSFGCGAVLNPGDDVLEFARYRHPCTDVEEKIYGEDGEIPLANYYLCAACGEIYLNLSDIGYECIAPTESMSELLSEYHDLTGFVAGMDYRLFRSCPQVKASDA